MTSDTWGVFLLAKPVPLFSLLISISRKSLLLQLEKMVKRVVFPHLRSTGEKFPTDSEFWGWIVGEKGEKWLNERYLPWNRADSTEKNDRMTGLKIKNFLQRNCEISKNHLKMEPKWYKMGASGRKWWLVGRKWCEVECHRNERCSNVIRRIQSYDRWKGKIDYSS